MTDYVEIFVARGDKGTFLLTPYSTVTLLTTVTLICTVRQTGNSEHMLKVLSSVSLVKRSDFEQIVKGKFGANADKENVKQGRPRRVPQIS